MQSACWPFCCYFCPLCACHHCCSQAYELAAAGAASSGCAAGTIVATAATTPDTIASKIGERCFFCPLLLPPVTAAHPVFADLRILLGPAFPWLGPGWLPLTLSASRCVRESAMSHINTQVHDITHTTQVQGATCKSMTSPRVRASVHGVNDRVRMRV